MGLRETGSVGGWSLNPTHNYAEVSSSKVSDLTTTLSPPRYDDTISKNFKLKINHF